MSEINTAPRALRDVILADADVLAITTTVAPWVLWRTDDLPAITYHKVSRTGTYTYEGALGWVQRRIQLKCWAATFDEAQKLAGAVTRKLDGYMHAQHGDIYIHRLRVDDDTDIDEAPSGGAEKPPYGVDLDVIMAYEHREQNDA